MIDVGGDDGAAAGDLGAHELGRDVRRDVGAEAVAVGQRRLGAGEHGDAAEVLAVGNVGHFLGDDAGARVFELRDGLARQTSEGLRLFGEVASEMARRDVAVVLGPDLAADVLLDAAALFDPGFACARQPARHVDLGRRIGVGAGRIVGAERRLAALSPSARSRATARASREDRPATDRPWSTPATARWSPSAASARNCASTLFMALSPAVYRGGERKRQRSVPWEIRCRCGGCRRRRGARWSRRDRARWVSSRRP